MSDTQNILKNEINIHPGMEIDDISNAYVLNYLDQRVKNDGKNIHLDDIIPEIMDNEFDPAGGPFIYNNDSDKFYENNKGEIDFQVNEYIEQTGDNVKFGDTHKANAIAIENTISENLNKTVEKMADRLSGYEDIVLTNNGIIDEFVEAYKEENNVDINRLEKISDPKMQYDIKENIYIDTKPEVKKEILEKEISNTKDEPKININDKNKEAELYIESAFVKRNKEGKTSVAISPRYRRDIEQKSAGAYVTDQQYEQNGQTKTSHFQVIKEETFNELAKNAGYDIKIDKNTPVGQLKEASGIAFKAPTFPVKDKEVMLTKTSEANKSNKPFNLADEKKRNKEAREIKKDSKSIER